MNEGEKLQEPMEQTIIEPCVKNNPDNLFICWASPEERCKGSVLRLHPNYKANHVLILRYSDHESRKREENIREMREVLKKVGNVEEIFIDENRPMPILEDLVKKIHDLTEGDPHPRVTIDITSPIKWHLLILLRLLDRKNLLDYFRFLYTEPQNYITDLFQPLSFGIKEIFPIPLYSGNYDFSLEDFLILILGYEGSRAASIYEEIDPTDCILLIADPPYHEEWRGRTEEMNKDIINIVGKSKIKYIDSRNPLKVALQLQTILSNKYYSKFNHIISPLGTKPQTLGLYLYLSTNPSTTTLIYGAPQRHNELFYSSGIGRTWILPFEKLKR